MNKFEQEINKEGTKIYTENGARCHNTTDNALVDLFSVIGALRNAEDTRIHNLIDCAYKEDKDLLTRMLFYARDVRGGLGERDTFRKAIKYCARMYPDVVEHNIALIPSYGRWDDLFSLMDTPLEKDMFKYMRNVLDKDLELVQAGNPTVTLLAKWLPTADASSDNTREFAKRVAKGLGFDGIRSYKNAYKPIRKVLNTPESKMSANLWSDIKYEKVPGRSMFCHSRAFEKHDYERFGKYLNDVRAGRTTVHTDALYPYDIVRKVIHGESDDVIDTLWEKLPNYIDGEYNFLVMADTSGSMYNPNDMPISSALGLALYFAQRNTGAYHNLFMTFSAEPDIIKIKGDRSICQIINDMSMCDWGMNTNLEKAFDKILNIAIKNKSPQKDIPKSLIIISDMEFDSCISSYARKNDVTFFEAMKHKYKKNGYDVPNVVFWNVNSRHDTMHVKNDEPNVQLVSGSSPSTFRNLIDNLNSTPYETMMKVLSSERYAFIKAGKYSDGFVMKSYM